MLRLPATGVLSTGFRGIHLSLFPLVVALLTLAQGALIAHEYPLGEVTPRIDIQDETFIVSSRDNTHQKDGELRVVTRTVNRKGRVLRTRAEVRPYSLFESYDFYSFRAELSEDQNGLERKYRDGWLIIPEIWRKHGGKPYLIQKQGDQFSYHPLQWNFSGVNEVIDAIIDNDILYLLVTRSGTSETELWLHRFSLLSFKEEAGVRLPDPCVVYSPVCSNLMLHEQMVYIAIVCEHFLGKNLVLVGWDSSSHSLTTKSLTHRIDWNTTVMLARIGDDALVAYHHPPLFRPSKVQIIHTKLKTP